MSHMSSKSLKAKKSEKLPVVFLVYLKILGIISPTLLVKHLAKLFTTPFKHKTPKRELDMDRNSKQELILIPNLDKKIMVYHYGNEPRKVLLVHGWSGRGTQLFKFADALRDQGYSTISFDAPAHGKSPGKNSIMTEFISAIKEIDTRYGPFDAAIGHSLGGMALLNSVKNGLKINSLTVIGSGDIINDIITDFIHKLKLPKKYVPKLRDHFEKISNEPMDNYSAYHGAATTQIPTLVIHDEYDAEVPISCALHIHKHLRNGELIITRGLGHRKILGDETIIKNTITFIKTFDDEKYNTTTHRVCDDFM